jgi:hypothetical protein
MYYWKHDSRLQHISMFHFLKNPKKHLKSMLYQNIVYDFLLQVPTAPTFLPRLCLKNPHLFSKT